MKNKILLIGFCFAVFSQQTLADGNNLNGPVQIDCKGDAGEVNVSVGQDKTFTYSVNVGATQLNGKISPIPMPKGDLTADSQYSTGGSSYLCVECAQDASWLSVGGELEKTVWRKESTGCQPTRGTDCEPYTTPGHYSLVTSDYVDVMLDMDLNAGGYKFNRVEMITPEFKKTISSLGTNTACTVHKK